MFLGRFKDVEKNQKNLVWYFKIYAALLHDSSNSKTGDMGGWLLKSILNNLFFWIDD